MSTRREFLTSLFSVGMMSLAAAVVRDFQNTALERHQSAEINMIGWQSGQFCNVVVGEKALCDERLGRDQQRIAGKCRRTGVRRITEAGRPERQHLPQRLAGARQVLEEGDRRWSEVADAEAAWQRAGVQQHARAAAVKLL